MLTKLKRAAITAAEGSGKAEVSVSTEAEAAALKPGFDVAATIAEANANVESKETAAVPGAATAAGTMTATTSEPSDGFGASMAGAGILGKMRRRAAKSTSVEDMAKRLKKNDPALRRLVLENAQLGFLAAEQLGAALAKNHMLDTLRLAGNTFGDEGAIRLAAGLAAR